jgi:hypothetical protein
LFRSGSPRLQSTALQGCFRIFRLGIWGKRSKVVGAVKRGKTKEETINNTFGGKNTINNYMIGLDLIVCKVWVDFTFRPTLGRK